MPSFNVVNNVDMQEMSNAVNNARKELTQRYDFRGSNTEIELDAKAKLIVASTEDEMKVEALRDTIITHAVRRKLDPACLDLGEPQPAGGMKLRLDVKIVDGIDRDIARKITRDVKDSKLKVQVAVQGVVGEHIGSVELVLFVGRLRAPCGQALVTLGLPLVLLIAMHEAIELVEAAGLRAFLVPDVPLARHQRLVACRLHDLGQGDVFAVEVGEVAWPVVAVDHPAETPFAR